MTVLDFGAGTYWLSRLIAQLNCGVICCDPSAVALDIGRRFFEEHPPLTRELLPPRSSSLTGIGWSWQTARPDTFIDGDLSA